MMTTVIAAKRTATLAVLIACALSAGCAIGPGRRSQGVAGGREATADVTAPPKPLLADVRRVVESPPLSLGVESVDRWHARHRVEALPGRLAHRPPLAGPHPVPDRGHPRLGRPDGPSQAARDRRDAAARRRGPDLDREPRVAAPKRAQDTLRQILEQLPR